MSYDRLQEMFRYITPGLYLLALVLIVNFEAISINDKLCDTISKLSAVIIVLMPFVGFVFGYLIECLMTWFERLLYFWGIPRPSRVVLNGKCSLYVIGDEVRQAVTTDKKVKNNVANRYQQIAKQTLGDNDVISRCYYQSIMARHILGAQLLASIYYLAFASGWSWGHLFLAVIILLILAFFWYHQTCVYMKYLFAEYAKYIKQQLN